MRFDGMCTLYQALVASELVLARASGLVAATMIKLRLFH
eukprot:SAG31_NODE_15308_length_761_cov_0.930514_1_plen_38_part_10